MQYQQPMMCDANGMPLLDPNQSSMIQQPMVGADGMLINNYVGPMMPDPNQLSTRFQQ